MSSIPSAHSVSHTKTCLWDISHQAGGPDSHYLLTFLITHYQAKPLRPVCKILYLLTHRLTKTHIQYSHLGGQPQMKEGWCGVLIQTG